MISFTQSLPVSLLTKSHSCFKLSSVITYFVKKITFEEKGNIRKILSVQNLLSFLKKG